MNRWITCTYTEDVIPNGQVVASWIFRRLRHDLGYVLASLDDGPRPTTVELEYIEVRRPDHRGLGYGRRMLHTVVRHVIDQHPSVETVTLKCIDDRTVLFYKKCGFQKKYAESEVTAWRQRGLSDVYISINRLKMTAPVATVLETTAAYNEDFHPRSKYGSTGGS